MQKKFQCLREKISNIDHHEKFNQLKLENFKKTEFITFIEFFSVPTCQIVNVSVTVSRVIV